MIKARLLQCLFLLIFVSGAGWAGKTKIAPLEIKCTPQEITAFQGEKVEFEFTISNRMPRSIRPGTNYFISYHLYDIKGKKLVYDNRRYALPRVLRRNKETRFKLPVFFKYPISGKYIIEFDIVNEGKFWGSSKKWKTCNVNLNLKPLVSDGFKKKYLPRFISSGNSLIDREQHLLRITLKNCEIRNPDGSLFGFAAGSDYPAVWIRDTATFIAYALRYYPVKKLSAVIGLFLQHQGQAGDIVDWVDISGKTDKNTVETDQESSLVLAALEIARKNPEWLGKKINGKPIWLRLNKALQWVWDYKRDKKYNLIRSALTADWGDTDNSYPDQRATKFNEKSTPVLGIYTQAKYIQAIEALIQIYRLYPAATKGKNWQWNKRLNILKKQARKLLYLKDKKYYLSHIVPSDKDKKYFKIEKNILAVGGNAEAIIAGLMNKNEIRDFLNVLEARRKEYKLRTVSFTLLPPYPENFFTHHLLARPWNYQNGGEWDWIGARVVKALFMKGFIPQAKGYLMEIVKKNLANYCIFEWEDRQGNGRGALYYVGAAGLIGEIIQTQYYNN